MFLFSNDWKKSRQFFQRLENQGLPASNDWKKTALFFQRLEKPPAGASNDWKIGP
jgi:hypothetical protein